MSAFIPSYAEQNESRHDNTVLRQEPYSPSEQRNRWEVRAAQWRAREIAQLVLAVFWIGLTGIRGRGEVRGLLRLDVPFDDLCKHHDRETRFMAAVLTDPVLSAVPLLYVIGPEKH